MIFHVSGTLTAGTSGTLIGTDYVYGRKKGDLAVGTGSDTAQRLSSAAVIMVQGINTR